MNEKNVASPARQESLQERSARLEAEATRLASGEETGSGGESQQPEMPAVDNAALEALQTELAQAKDQMLRALAEAENARKRGAREREDAGKYAIAGFAKDLISVADNLRRAIEATPRETADEGTRALLAGIEATERELLKSFEKNGIRKVDPIGEAFNPNFHEVIFEAPGTGKPPGTITQVMEVGYVLNDRLLRPARVGIAKDEGQGSGPPGGHIDTKA